MPRHYPEPIDHLPQSQSSLKAERKLNRLYGNKPNTSKLITGVCIGFGVGIGLFLIVDIFI